MTKDQNPIALRDDLRAKRRAMELEAAAKLAQVPALEVKLAEAGKRGDVSAITATHLEIARIQESARADEAAAATLKEGELAAEIEVQKLTSASAAEVARGLGAEIRREKNGVKDALMGLVPRLDALAEQASRFDSERGRARSAAEKAAVPLPAIGTVRSPFQKWARDLTAVINEMETKNDE